jgi:periplasmic protein TonB
MRSLCRSIALLLPVLSTLAAAGPVPAQTSGQEAAAASLLTDGDRFLAQGEHRRAVGAFEQANRVYEDRCAACFLGLSRAYTAWQRYDQAAEAARAALQLSPPAELYARAANQLGVALILQRPPAGTVAFAEAEAAFRRALESGGEAWNAARYNLAGLLLSAGQAGQAASQARDYLRAEPAGPYAPEARLLACGTGRSAPPPAATAPEGDFFPPAPVFRRPPALSPRARRAGLGGGVAVQVEVDADGCVTNAVLIKGLGNELDAAAVEAARGWVFTPATAGGRPVASDYMLTVDFGSATDDGKEVDRQFRERVLAKWPVQSR